MTVEAGVLALRIQEEGAAQVEQKLASIDAKAKALGAKTTTVKVSAPDLTLIDRQLEQLGKQVTLFKQGAQFAGTRAQSLRELGQVEAQLRGIVQGTNTSLEQRIAAERQLGQLLGGRVAGTQSLTSAIGTQLAAYLSFRAAVTVYDSVTSAADRQEIAQRKLSATARLTGESLSTITAISAGAQSKFAISSSSAADLTQSFVKLASRSGNVAQTGALMNAWMDLAAAQGLSLDQVMTGVNSTLVGQDEGLNRLGLLNPSNLWKQWADAAGTTVAKMTEQQKWQAIVDAVTMEGAKVQGEYQKSLQTTAGQQQVFTSALEATAASFGNSIAPARQFLYELGTGLLNAIRLMNNMDDSAAGMGAKFRVLWGFITGGAAGGTAALLATDKPAFLRQGPPLSGKGSPTKPPPSPPSAAEISAARKVQEQIDKALGIDLGNIPLVGGTTPVTAPGLLGVDSKGQMKGVKPFGIADVLDKELMALRAKAASVKEEMSSIVVGVAQTVGGAFSDAFSAAFEGGNFFAEFGKSLLRSLGNMIMELGASMLAYGLILAPLGALLSFTPFAPLGLGVGASIAAGLALTALGAGMGALGGGKGGKGGGAGGGGGAPQSQEQNEFQVAFDPDRKLRQSSGSAVAPRARALGSSPIPDARPVVHIGTINSLSPDSAAYQRSIADTFMNARARGLVRHG